MKLRHTKNRYTQVAAPKYSKGQANSVNNVPVMPGRDPRWPPSSEPSGLVLYYPGDVTRTTCLCRLFLFALSCRVLPATGLA